MIVSTNLRSTGNSDGTKTVRIRISHDRKSKYITLFKINPKYFNNEKGLVRKSHPKSDELNFKIQTELHALNSKVNELKYSGLEFTLENLFNTKGDYKELNHYLDLHAEHLKSIDKHSSARKYTNLKDKVNLYDKNVLVKKIDKNWMEGFYHFLDKQEYINSKETINRYIKFLKTILRKAKENNQEVNDKALNYKLTNPKSYKTKLTPEEIKAIANFNNSKYALSRDTFMLQFHTRGSRISDILKLTSDNIQNGNLVFDEQKTGKKKIVEINSAIQKILDNHKGKTKFNYLLPWMDIDPELKKEMSYMKKIESKTAMLNKDLKIIAASLGIDKKVSSHVARHSFAHVCLKSGVDLGSISDLLNHSSPRVTQAYLTALSNDDELNDITKKISNLVI